MHVIVSLGHRHLAEPIKLQAKVTPSMAELPPDTFFDALNRIGADFDGSALDHQKADVQRIKARHEGITGIMLTYLRRQLDNQEAPSMSVEDRIEFYSDNRCILVHVCEPIGWTTTVPSPAT